MRVRQSLANKLSEATQLLYGTGFPASRVQLQKTRPEFEGDLTVVVFPFLRLSKKSPEQTAGELGAWLKANIPYISSFNVIKGFLNLVIDDNYWIESLSLPFSVIPQSAESILLEYSSPNTNKPLHLGHIRNNLLGFSVSEILKINGHNITNTQIINDRGIHICKSMLAWQKWGMGETPESSGLKGDKLVGKYYVEFQKRYIEENKDNIDSIFKGDFSCITNDNDLHSIKKYLKIAIEDKNSTKEEIEKAGKLITEIVTSHSRLTKEAQEMLRRWEAKDTEVITLWKRMNSWVYDGFEQTYKALGVSFDKNYYESETYLYGKQIVEDGVKKGLFYKKEDSSVWCDLTKEGLDEKLVLRSDGTSVYVTQDIGTAILRLKDFPGTNKLIYTVGNEQDYHFKVLFAILKKLGYDWADKCYHLSYGMVDLPSGKMKSREGTVVDADDLIEEMIHTAKQTTEELGKLGEIPEEKREELFRIIGMGALKYFILKVDPKKRMLFNPKESIDFNGNTGPFIQYTYARIQSLLRKADFKSPAGHLPQVPGIQKTEKQVLKFIYEYPEILREAADTYSPAVIANYIYELVKEYNHFYQTIPVLSANDRPLVNFRLLLSYKTGEVIKSAMNLLGIEVPEKM